MRLTVVGCGDAFGSGGRLNTCFHVVSKESTFLIDCGASALIGLNKLDLPPDDIDTIYITHLHGDHFGGLAWFLIDAQHVRNRTKPLTIAGPEGLKARFETATEALFPKATSFPRQFDITFKVWEAEQPMEVPGGRVIPFEVLHFSGAPPFALRFEIDGKILTFSGDTEWVESLVPAAANADLFISECYQFDIQAKMHLDYKTIEKHLPRIAAKRVLLTHMSTAMLAKRNEINHDLCIPAEDGMVLEI